jgi:glucan phosphoethanolaminetransferase (alkaline phosphatase superfamily)
MYALISLWIMFTLIILIYLVIHSIVTKMDREPWIKGTLIALCVMLGSVSCYIVYSKGRSADTAIIESYKQEAKIQEYNQVEQYKLVSDKLQTQVDKIIIEDIEDYNKKVTSDKGMYKLTLLYDDTGRLKDIDTIEKIY